MSDPDLPDLAALREKAEKATRGPWKQDLTVGHFLVLAGRETLASARYSRDAVYITAASPDVMLAVLALVATLQTRVESLERALSDLIEAGDDTEFVGIWESGAVARFVDAMHAAYEIGVTGALSVSPAEKKTP